MQKYDIHLIVCAFLIQKKKLCELNAQSDAAAYQVSVIF